MTEGILVLDLGTTELKAVLFDADFSIVSQYRCEWKYTHPRRGWIEHPAIQYWTACLDAMKTLLAHDEHRRKLRAISVTGQAETLVTLDHDGQALGEAIVWLDTRAQEEAKALSGKITPGEMYARTGNDGFDPVMPVCKIPWIRANQPERYAETSKFLLIKEYIIFKLTGVLVGECSALSCSGYFNIVTRSLDLAILDAADIDRGKLPDPEESLSVVGCIHDDLAKFLDICPDVRVVNGMLDQCASAIGAGNIVPGAITETTGTVLAIAATVDSFEPASMIGRFPVLSHALPGRYLALPNCPTAGVLLNWFRDQFLPDHESFEHIDRCVAERSADPDGVIALPHFSGRLSPVHVPDALVVLYGLTLSTDKYHIARALMESVGFLLRENLELLKDNGIASDEVVSLGGGSRSGVWTQIKADICKAPFRTLECAQSTALGCAIGAAYALGMIDSIDEATRHIGTACSFAPDPATMGIYDKLYHRYRTLNANLGFE